jgi:2-oxoglutarate dehydrogenase E2 component (dihydrolipoamide succinyltransferase)
MARFEIVMPKLGESIIEATITKWLKNVGDTVKEDESILEIATDKVDSEIPSPVEGKITEVLFKEGDVVAIGTVIAVIDMGDEDTGKTEDGKLKTEDGKLKTEDGKLKTEEKAENGRRKTENGRTEKT